MMREFAPDSAAAEIDGKGILITGGTGSFDRSDVVVVDAVPAIGQERRHAPPTTRCICASSSHSSLVSLA